MPTFSPTARHALSASYYADRAVWCSAEITDHARIARETYRLRFHAPEIARRIEPGQFIMLRLAGFDDPLLGRALALFDIALDAAGKPADVEVVYMVVGKMTSRLTAFQPGQRLEIWGPLGNGFPHIDTRHLIMVAGGVGITPFLAVAKRYLGMSRFAEKRDRRRETGENERNSPSVSCLTSPSPNPKSQIPTSGSNATLCYGARTADYFAALEAFQKLGVDVRLSTDDGSRGHRGRVTDVLAEVLSAERRSTIELVDRSQETGGNYPSCGAEATRPPVSCLLPPSANPESQIPNPAPNPRSVFCCGPEPMMEAVTNVCLDADVPCYVSLETPMACGVGICFTCVAKVRQSDGEWDYKRTCVEGPVFDARRIVWH